MSEQRRERVVEVDGFGGDLVAGLADPVGDRLGGVGEETVVAPADGQLTHFEDPLGGLSYSLEATGGAYYYGTHLSAYENEGTSDVPAGTVIGYVGTTGNATSTPPHLHWQIHPTGKSTPPINPTPTATGLCATDLR